MKKVTITDIAKLTGYSIKTVSRVINNAPNVREETRRKILQVIEEHKMARSHVKEFYGQAERERL